MPKFSNRFLSNALSFTRWAVVAALITLTFSSQAKDDYRIAWSIYVGWMPWDYAERNGIVDKWAGQIRHLYRSRSIQRLHRVY